MAARSATSHITRAVRLATARPHDFTIQYPIRREYFQDNFYTPSRDEPQRAGQQQQAQQSEPRRRRQQQPPIDLSSQLAESLAAATSPANLPLLLYLHIPFCASKCSYCNFAVDTRAAPEIHAQYLRGLDFQLDALDRAVARAQDSSGAPVRVGGIDIGGGTPSILPTAELAALISRLEPWRDAASSSGVAFPLSMETTPVIAAEQPDKMAALARAGLDRISMGLQSSSATMLEAVGRGAQAGAPARAAEAIHAAGFARFSVDVIFGLPDQSMDMWMDDIAAAIRLEPHAITTYDCLYRGKGRVMSRSVTHLPGWDSVYGPMYDAAYDALAAAGYHAPYGSVNFSRVDGETGVSAYFEARLKDGAPYVGLGNYASSYLDGPTWAFAPYSVDGWLDALSPSSPFPAAFAYALPVPEAMAKHALLALSFGGLDPARFARAFPDSPSLDAVYGDTLAQAVRVGWLVRDSTGPSGPSYALAPGAFKWMPHIRALLHTPGSLDWFQSALASARPV